MDRKLLIVLIIGILIGTIFGFALNVKLNVNDKIEGFVDGYSAIIPKTNMSEEYYKGYIAGSRLYIADNKKNTRIYPVVDEKL